MPNIAQHKSSQVTKLLLMGNHGAGKTGSLVSLAQAGYNLRILDTDAGLDVISSLARDDPRYAQAASHIDYETFTDTMKSIGGKLAPGKATVWQNAMKLLDNWKTDSADYGPLTSWTSQDVLVIDSLSSLSKAALNFILAMNARIGQKPHQSDWYDGQLLVEGFLEKLADDNVKTNVVVLAHITFIGEESGPQQGYPNTLGSKLPPKVGRHFNSMLMMKSSGTGQNVKRQIHTAPQGLVELKNSAPTKVKPSYDIAFGLAEFFKDVRGEPGK